ncbi:3-keto-5-aminohexanoate cleavage protein [Aliiroseovarius subalbicans]|uniref:3-keto-5-aminohexanoate cleavage protein n=1 Tax=Aliiroseovarius subalbicans TaxID=2925840 RepID=UPI001F5A56F0|nr:3-keto-5-aminohexanoate cleavage protein [Aliiroseovarius subalbicans]MCI2399655.1 3-keto-5-aminohexanoate cleavage protein [Aliiroseovarius subalbicans]
MGTAFDLMVAPNGARLGKADHPAVPCTAEELSRTAAACAAAGAGAIHLHVRDADGHHALDANLYDKAIAAVAQRTPIRVQMSTEAVGIFDVPTQIECLRAVKAPDASIALREITRRPDLLTEAYKVVEANGTDVQHILYDAADLELLLQYFDQGLIAPRSRRVLFVLGRYSEHQVATPDDLTPFLAVPGARDLTWSVCAFGPKEHDCLMAALNTGGHARIGFENNTIAADGTPYPDNAASVAAFVETAARAGFQPRRVMP